MQDESPPWGRLRPTSALPVQDSDEPSFVPGTIRAWSPVCTKLELRTRPHIAKLSDNFIFLLQERELLWEMV